MTLPPDPEGMNDARAEWADEAIKTFVKRTGTDFEDSLGDLLCDLMHWSDRNNFDFNNKLEWAKDCYVEETWDDAEAAA